MFPEAGFSGKDAEIPGVGVRGYERDQEGGDDLA